MINTPARRQVLGTALALGAGRGLAFAAPASRGGPLGRVSGEKLTITDIKVTPLSFELPADKRWYLSRSVTWKTDACLIEVFTKEGLVGIGEGTPYAGPDKIKTFVESQIRPALLGKNPFDVEFLTTPWTNQRLHVSAAGFAGVDVALWDLIGKAKGKPVYKLLAGDTPPSPTIKIYASAGVQHAWYRRGEDLIDEALRYKEAGYDAFKFRLGTEWKAAGMTVKKYVPLLHKLRAAVGKDFSLMQEANMRLSLAECLELAPTLEELGFLWFEEPIKQQEPGALDDHLKIHAALPKVMISGGEALSTRIDFKEWIDRGGYDIVQPDCNVTGLTEALHIARAAALHGKPCIPHNWHGGLTTMANASLAAAIPNRMYCELNQTYNPFKEELFRDPLVVKKGKMTLHDRPGFGMEVIPSPEKKFPYIPGPYSRPNPDMPAPPA